MLKLSSQVLLSFTACLGCLASLSTVYHRYDMGIFQILGNNDDSDGDDEANDADFSVQIIRHAQCSGSLNTTGVSKKVAI